MFDSIGSLVTAWMLADFVAGVIHWLEDRYFREEWPIIGRYVAIPNQLHHAQPTAFLFHGYWRRNWTTILPAAIVLTLVLLAGGPYVICLSLIMLSQANQIHAWAHSKGTVPRCVAILQQTGILQSPKHHAEHHRSPFATRYCVMSNWLNPLLDTFAVWQILEVLLATVGILPRK